jgi:hypothetical protein
VERRLRELGREHRSGWLCPAHDDHKPSLTVNQGVKGVVLKCHRNTCTFEQIVAALDLTAADLFDVDKPNNTNTRSKTNSNTKTGRKSNAPLGDLVATYDYTDEEGNFLFQTVRYANPKDFRQRRKGPRGGWIGNLDGVRRVVYRLPEVVQGVKDGCTVFIPEGEKDVDALVSLGEVATCNPMGAGGWKSDYTDMLAGAKKVVVIADRDKPGYTHARHVADELSKVVPEVTLVEPAEGKDVSDHLEAGFTLADLEEVTERADDVAGADDESDEKVPQATALVRLAERGNRFVQGDDGRVYAVPLQGPNLARPLKGRNSLRASMAAAYYQHYRKAPSSSALADFLNVIEGRALAAEREPLALRVAAIEGGIVLDLGTGDGKVVVVDKSGWRVLDRSPVLFRRTELTGALPEPTSGGDLEKLREHINVTDEAWHLLVAVLVCWLMSDIPRPVTLLTGQHGTGKSTTARLLASMIDPSPAQLRAAPRDFPAWVLTASSSWVVALDNLSSIPEWLSDAICRASTGEGDAKRSLYSDDSLTVFSFRRNVMLTAIDAGALRGDLGDRLVPLEQDPINPSCRKLDKEIAAAFGAAHPGLLGALLDLVVKVLGELPNVQVTDPPRMADFAHVLAAVDAVTGWESLSEYRELGGQIAAQVIESDPVAQRVAELARSHSVEKAGEPWEGTATELLTAITPERVPKDWPRNGRAMGGRLRRAAPALRSTGIGVDFPRTEHARQIRLTVESRRNGEPKGEAESKGKGDLPSSASFASAKPLDQPRRDDANEPSDLVCVSPEPVCVRTGTTETADEQGVCDSHDANDGDDGQSPVPSIGCVLDAFPRAEVVS